MKFIREEFDRWTCGPYTISKYDDGYYAYVYFKYKSGAGRDSKRLHGTQPRQIPHTLDDAVRLCFEHSLQPVPDGRLLINAPSMNIQCIET